MAEKKKKKGLLERATDYVTDAATSYLANRRRMSERLENPTAPPKQRGMEAEPGSKPPGVIPYKPKKKEKEQGGVAKVMGTVKERKKRMKKALEM